TERHSQRVTEYTESIARRLGIDAVDLDVIRRGALLHDIGKIGVPDSSLRKEGPLTAGEWTEMRKHPEVGWRAIRQIPFLSDAATIVLHHHERWDGGGSPQRLCRTGIHIGARIFAVAGALDAITSDRPYRRARPWAYAVEEIVRQRGGSSIPTSSTPS